MAVIKRGILGGVQNKIGNVVGSSWKGIATLRSLPLSVSNPRTAAQTEVRNKFSAASKLASTLLASVIKPLWDRFSQQQSGYNAWIQANINAFQDDGTPSLAYLVMSKGSLAVSPITTFNYVAATEEIEVAWNPSPGGDANSTDVPYVVLLVLRAGEVIAYSWSTGFTRGMSGGAYQLPDGLQSGDSCMLYLSFRKADGTKVSDTYIFPKNIA